MNIQIFGRKKCFDTKKAERYFKERGVKYQYIDLDRFGISKGEYRSVRASVDNIAALIETKAKNYDSSCVGYLFGEAAKEEKLMADPTLFRTPIVRNGKQATVGYQADIWKTWE